MAWFNSRYFSCHHLELGSTLVTSQAPIARTWFNSCYIPCLLFYFQYGSTLVTSHTYLFIFSMVQLLLHPMLNPSSWAWFNSCYIPCLLFYFQYGSTLVTSHTYLFIFSMVQLLLHPMLNPSSIKSSKPFLSNHMHNQYPACKAQHSYITHHKPKFHTYFSLDPIHINISIHVFLSYQQAPHTCI